MAEPIITTKIIDEGGKKYVETTTITKVDVEARKKLLQKQIDNCLTCAPKKAELKQLDAK